MSDIIENAIKGLKQSSINETNKELILKFKDNCFADGLSKKRIIKYIYSLKRLSLWLNKNFNQADKDDIKLLVSKIEMSDYANWTKHDFKIAIKKFYKWLKGLEEEYPQEVKWIKTTMKNNKIKLPSEMLTENDIKRLVDAAEHPRDRAFVTILYESGCRIEEIMNLKIKDIDPFEYGLTLTVKGKTGMRIVRVISSVPYLKRWLNEHPFKHDPNALLWVSRDKRASLITYNRIRHILNQLKEKAKLNKKVNPHNFRHSRATYLANFLTEAQMCEFFGWTQGSDMPGVYVHLSGRDVDSALLKTYGIKSTHEEDEKSNGLKPIECPACQEVNGATDIFCSHCGTVLDEKTRLKIIKNEQERKQADNILDELIKEDRFRKMFEEAVEKKVEEMMKRQELK